MSKQRNFWQFLTKKFQKKLWAHNRAQRARGPRQGPFGKKKSRGAGSDSFYFFFEKICSLYFSALMPELISVAFLVTSVLQIISDIFGVRKIDLRFACQKSDTIVSENKHCYNLNGVKCGYFTKMFPGWAHNENSLSLLGPGWARFRSRNCRGKKK